MQTVSLGDNLHEVSDPIFWEKEEKYPMLNLPIVWLALTSLYFVLTELQIPNTAEPDKAASYEFDKVYTVFSGPSVQVQYSPIPCTAQ